MEVLSMLYNQFQLKLTEEAKQRFQIFLKAHPKGKHDNLLTSLEAFGLSQKEIENKFAVYLKFLEKL